MHTEDDTLEREMAWVIAQKYRSRAKQLVLVEPQRKGEDCNSKAPQLRLLTDDAEKLDAPGAVTSGGCIAQAESNAR